MQRFADDIRAGTYRCQAFCAISRRLTEHAMAVQPGTFDILSYNLQALCAVARPWRPVRSRHRNDGSLLPLSKELSEVYRVRAPQLDPNLSSLSSQVFMLLSLSVSTSVGCPRYSRVPVYELTALGAVPMAHTDSTIHAQKLMKDVAKKLQDYDYGWNEGEFLAAQSASPAVQQRRLYSDTQHRLSIVCNSLSGTSQLSQPYSISIALYGG